MIIKVLILLKSLINLIVNNFIINSVNLIIILFLSKIYFNFINYFVVFYYKKIYINQFLLIYKLFNYF
jgi:hypothetical protein